jgi:hypothetical protein
MPGSSEDELLVQPLEQAHAETILQRLHLLPDRSGSDVQLVRRDLEARQVQPCPLCPVSDGRPEKGGLS